MIILVPTAILVLLLLPTYRKDFTANFPYARIRHVYSGDNEKNDETGSFAGRGTVAAPRRVTPKDKREEGTERLTK